MFDELSFGEGLFVTGMAMFVIAGLIRKYLACRDRRRAALRDRAILCEARQLARDSTNCVELCNQFFNRRNGLMVRYFPDRSERVAFRRREACAKLWEILEEKILAEEMNHGPRGVSDDLARSVP